MQEHQGAGCGAAGRRRAAAQSREATLQPQALWSCVLPTEWLAAPCQLGGHVHIIQVLETQQQLLQVLSGDG